MKSAYELAMERLNKQSPPVKLTGEQKAKIAELEARYRARLAEREIALKGAADEAAAKGDLAETEKLQRQLGDEKKKLADDLEERKEAVRQGKA